jgi:hypothetical protein
MVNSGLCVRSIPSLRKVAAELIYPLKATYYEALEVKLVGNTQVQRHIERIVMRDEWAGNGPTWYALEHRRIHFECSPVVEERADSVLHLGDADECIASRRG